MIPVLQAEQTLATVDALMVVSEYTEKNARQTLIKRLVALTKHRTPNANGEYPDDLNRDGYPGEFLWGGNAVRAWLTLKGGFRKGEIQS